jgi:thiol-disulfide isomerase/thioredoxin
MKNLLSIICVIAVIGNNIARAQTVNINTTVNPLINQLCPAFSFDTLFNYPKEKLALSELKGKFVIVDFWGTFCLPCIAAFPKLETWQKQFGDSFQILLVATDGYQKTKQFYETRKKANKPMTLPCTINRSMAKYFQVKEVSTYVWIDDKGYIKAITDESQLTEKNIADFINRKEIVVREKEKRVNIDYKKPLIEIAKEIDSNSVVFGSVLTRYVKGLSSVINYSRKGINRNRILAHNMGIRNLYQVAYGDDSIGSVPLARTVIESAHPEKLARPQNVDFETWKVDNTYCYEISVPEAKRDSIWKMIRDDLQQLFGYNAYLENRVQKCLVLKADKSFRYLADTMVTPVISISAGGITMINQPFSRVVDNISHFLQYEIFFDETGLSGKVAITIQAQMNDVDEVNRELKKYGLSLLYEDRHVPMLVIKDPR